MELLQKPCIINKTYITVRCTLDKSILKSGYKYYGALHLDSGAAHRNICDYMQLRKFKVQRTVIFVDYMQLRKFKVQCTEIYF